MARVSLKNVSKIFKGDKGTDVTAVADFSIEIQDREFIVLSARRAAENQPLCG